MVRSREQLMLPSTANSPAVSRRRSIRAFMLIDGLSDADRVIERGIAVIFATRMDAGRVDEARLERVDDARRIERFGGHGAGVAHLLAEAGVVGGWTAADDQLPIQEKVDRVVS